jgi:O-antigen/teichoic acid export membrane protein
MPGPVTRGGADDQSSEAPPPPLRFSPTVGLGDPGAVRNTLLQLISQVAGAVFTAGLTLYLVRTLGASGYGIYSLATTIGVLVVLPAGLGLPWAIGRFLADHIDDLDQLRSIFVLGLRLQATAGLLAAGTLFAVSGPVADALGHHQLGWTLRWVAVSVVGQTLFVYLASSVTSVRRVAISLWMSVVESAVQTASAVALVAAGAGAAGAASGVAIGYIVASAAGLFLTLRLLRWSVRGVRAKVQVAASTIARYAGAMFVVDFTWSATAQVDVVLIGAMLTFSAVGSFSAVLQILNVLSYLGIAVAGGVAPRLSLSRGAPDTRAFFAAIRYLIILQGLVIAPMVVWARPIVGLLLGAGYPSSPAIMRVLAVQAFVAGPAALVTVAVTYLGEARRRVWIALGSLALGLAATYVLIRAAGVVGAAVGDDIVFVTYVGAHFWICRGLVALDLRRLGGSVARTVAAAAAMAAPLAVAGTDRLSLGGWIVGGAVAVGLYAGTLLITREVSLGELVTLAGKVKLRVRPAVG